jgi:DNA invertase Pin-like site-specific DNA recombinase
MAQELALEQLKEEDVLVVWKLDRLSRSLKDLLQIMEQVHEAGAAFRSVTEAVDTNSGKITNLVKATKWLDA